MEKIFKVKSQIPKSLIEIAESRFKRSEPKMNLYKMYHIIRYHHLLEVKRNNKRRKPMFDSLVYAPLASYYFEKTICSRYHIYKKILVEEGYISPKMKFVWKPGTPLFEDSVVETYKVGRVSKAYKSISRTNEQYVELELEFNNRPNLVAQKNVKFLKSIGLENPSIKYDAYGYRLYHNLTNSYKEMENPDNYVCYDIKSSVPTFFMLKMKEEGIKDDPFLDLFNGDFYINFGRLIGFKGTNEEIRTQAKKTFMYVANEKRRMHKSIMDKIKNKLPLFDLMCRRKNIGRDLIQMESKFMHDVVVPGLKIDKIMTIFDCVIIHKKNQKIGDRFFQELALKKRDIKFNKGPIPKSKREEVSHAA